MTRFEYDPIGVVHSPFTGAAGTPIQPSRAGSARGTVEVFEEYAPGLEDLDGFSHVILLCHMHRARASSLKVVPYMDTRRHGVFATRAPSRPNPIGISVVELEGIDGNVLSVRGLDLLDGTPVLAIKPYIADFDHREGVRSGWFDSRPKDTDEADGRFE